MRKTYLTLSLFAVALVLGGCGGSSDNEGADDLNLNAVENATDADQNADEDPAASQEASAPKVQLPKLALACGGNGYRNGRLVFDPAALTIYDATIIDRTSTVSKSIDMQGSKIHAIMGPINSGPKTEIIFDPSTNTYQFNYNYVPGGDDEANSCFAEIDAAKRDCAEAANINQCIEIRHPGVMGKIVSGICSQSSSKWMEMQCDPIDDSEYASTLEMVKGYANN